ncbi:hypothetical protein N9195_02820 [bacterium]|nr:hypothetical protein [bacterium]
MRNRLAGIQSGVLRSGTYTFKYEVLQEPHPGLVLRGQVERDGGEPFENTYVFITKKEVITLKVNSAVAGSTLILSEWKFGEPLDRGRAEYRELMRGMMKRSNNSIEKFQKLVEGLRQE